MDYWLNGFTGKFELVSQTHQILTKVKISTV